MSGSYVNEPSTNGKIVLETSYGPIDIELWGRESPVAVRNFVQLSMEGYYDGTIFHRIIKDFCVQGGDPTGTGEGGESIYGQDFAIERHSRLKFRYRGIVAMANSGPGTQASQFFVALNALPHLDGKHTIIGKVVGNTLFNVMEMANVECNGDDRPLDPPTVTRARVVMNPFDDIVPRQLPAGKSAVAERPKKRKRKVPKNVNLLSFGDEAAEVDASPAGGMASSHDVLNDPTLSRDATAAAKAAADAEDALKKEKAKAAARAEAKTKAAAEDEARLQAAVASADAAAAAPAQVDSAQDAIRRLKRDLRAMDGKPAAKDGDAKRASAAKSALAARSSKYVRNGAKKRAGASKSEADVLAKLTGFTSRLKTSALAGELRFQDERGTSERD